jgi:hypothetical protein
MNLIVQFFIHAINTCRQVNSRLARQRHNAQREM